MRRTYRQLKYIRLVFLPNDIKMHIIVTDVNYVQRFFRLFAYSLINRLFLGNLIEFSTFGFLSSYTDTLLLFVINCDEKHVFSGLALKHPMRKQRKKAKTR